jgi:hypothetical protein
MVIPADNYLLAFIVHAWLDSGLLPGEREGLQSSGRVLCNRFCSLGHWWT